MFNLILKKKIMGQIYHDKINVLLNKHEINHDKLFRRGKAGKRNQEAKVVKANNSESSYQIDLKFCMERDHVKPSRIQSTKSFSLLLLNRYANLCTLVILTIFAICKNRDWIEPDDHFVNILLSWSSIGVCSSKHSISLRLCLLELTKVGLATLMRELGKRNWTKGVVCRQRVRNNSLFSLVCSW